MGETRGSYILELTAIIFASSRRLARGTGRDKWYVIYLILSFSIDIMDLWVNVCLKLYYGFLFILVLIAFGYAGCKYYYNSKTNVSQWEHPASSQKSAGQQGNEPKPTQQPVEIKKCSGCGGWGVGLVQSWGYCIHCTRYFICLPLTISNL